MNWVAALSQNSVQWPQQIIFQLAPKLPSSPQFPSSIFQQGALLPWPAPTTRVSPTLATQCAPPQASSSIFHPANASHANRPAHRILSSIAPEAHRPKSQPHANFTHVAAFVKLSLLWAFEFIAPFPCTWSRVDRHAPSAASVSKLTPAPHSTVAETIVPGLRCADSPRLAAHTCKLEFPPFLWFGRLGWWAPAPMKVALSFLVESADVHPS